MSGRIDRTPWRDRLDIFRFAGVIGRLGRDDRPIQVTSAGIIVAAAWQVSELIFDTEIVFCIRVRP